MKRAPKAVDFAAAYLATATAESSFMMSESVIVELVKVLSLLVTSPPSTSTGSISFSSS